ncbi:MAG: hypothetical protein COS94_08400 [Candidatus Hydrogenedentes bacterium CG07_land_8_20_14_0_80_42_17]|nr:MAG: hypothetical protein AUJ18_04510 [Candidatus Hydrogenedentes bacterium CG1_02_42_14]PIU47126.1 MAG: hypothetical protein COS94_08400 [Candidatus Hydrogenedentes bacterium CG07_land_8_20_14_0_80_42_17]
MNTSRNCSEYEDAFGALLSNDASKDDLRRANEHLSQCSKCAELYGSLAIFRERVSDVYGFEMRRPVRKIFRYAYLAAAASLLVGILIFRAENGNNSEAVRTNVDSSLLAVATNDVSAEKVFDVELTDEEANFILEFVPEDLQGANQNWNEWVDNNEEVSG